MEVNGCCQMFGDQHSLKYLILCLIEQRNGLKHLEDEYDDKTLIFG